MSKFTNKLSSEEWFAGAAMLGVMAIGLFQAVSALGSPGMQSVPLTLGDFREGRTTGMLSDQLDKNLPIRSELIAWANAARYVLTRGAGDQVRVGRDDWLFSVEELQFFDQGLVNQDSRLAMLIKTAKALQVQGVTLVVALVPDKARMYSTQLSGGHYPDWQADRYTAALETLHSQGVETVNLLPVLTPDPTSRPLYYRTDTHWNQLGAHRAAQAVAQRLKTLVTDLPPTTFVTSAAGPMVEKPGDLMRMMHLNDMPNWTRPRPDFEITESTRKAEAAQPAGLFDAVSVPVVLVGTSYSLRGNFHGYLQQALGVEVLNVARDGGGFIQSAKGYFTDDSFRTTKPQVIVWELPERMLSAPLSDQEKEGLSL